jgi:hypothetical protein
MRKRSLNRATLLLAVPALFGTGCATVHRYQASQTGQVLVAAGFQRRPADTSELRSVPPYRITSRTQGGKAVYTYADPDNCRCVYVGGENEYSEYERLSTPIPPRVGGASPSGAALGGAP